MSPENTKTLFERYPYLYSGRYDPITQNLMGFGFDCGDGWFKIIDELSAKLSVHDVKAMQVKEKFGTLRFYVCSAPDEAYDHINAAEHLSAQTCEDCGQPGRERSDGWIRTLCDDCHDARENPKPRFSEGHSGGLLG